MLPWLLSSNPSFFHEMLSRNSPLQKRYLVLRCSRRPTLWMSVLFCHQPAWCLLNGLVDQWPWCQWWRRYMGFFFFFYFIYDSHTEKERGRDTGRGRSRLHAPGARRGIRSRVSRIAPWAKGRRQTAAPLRDPWFSQYWCPFIIYLDNSCYLV